VIWAHWAREDQARARELARREDLDEQNPPQVPAPADDPVGRLTMAGTDRKRDDTCTRLAMSAWRMPLDQATRVVVVCGPWADSNAHSSSSF
jgi:hypothetical protein